MTQEKFTVSSEELMKKYSKELEIPSGSKKSKAIIGVVGDEYSSASGKFSFVPIIIIQSRSDVTSSSNQATEADKFFRGWEGFDVTLRHLENVTSDIFKNMKFKEGMELKGAQLLVDISFEPSYDDQEPLLNPETGEFVTSDGKYLYRSTRISFNPQDTHTGLDIERDTTEVTQVQKSDTVA